MSIPTLSFEYNVDEISVYKAAYNTSGIIHLKNAVPLSTIDLLLEEIAAIAFQIIKEQRHKINGVPILYGYDENGQQLLHRIPFINNNSPVLQDFANESLFQNFISFLDVSTARIGISEKDGMVFNQYLNTDSSSKKKMGWHTDSPRDWFLGTRIQPMMNVGIHLDDCPQRNGGLRVLPGTHLQHYFSLLFKKRYFLDHRPDVAEIGFDIKAGDITLHDGRLWHRVQQSPQTGIASRRRVLYLPIVSGTFQPKSEASKTPFYHNIARWLAIFR